ncbi:hypothetical protein ACFFLM_12015 [Deinococcus oregonensis]|uniref:Fungal lipase-like domain-containing protein n=1 Tax=Deinococcus oregonensis TaxID=1805970 RepID=A0ABV6AYW1_9DEIO
MTFDDHRKTRAGIQPNPIYPSMRQAVDGSFPQWEPESPIVVAAEEGQEGEAQRRTRQQVATRQRRTQERQTNEARQPHVARDRDRQRAARPAASPSPARLARQLLPLLQGTGRHELRDAQTFLNRHPPQTRGEVLKLLASRHAVQVKHLLHGLPFEQMEALLRLTARARSIQSQPMRSFSSSQTSRTPGGNAAGDPQGKGAHPHLEGHAEPTFQFALFSKAPAFPGQAQTVSPWNQALNKWQNMSPVERQANQLSPPTKQQNTINPKLAASLGGLPHVSTLTGQFGAPALANLLSGTTRHLAVLPPGQPNKLQNYRMPVIESPQAIEKLAQSLQAARNSHTLGALLQAFQQQHDGKSLYAVIGEQVRDPAQRIRLLKLLPPPVSQAQAIQDAFYETLAVGYSYANTTGRQMTGDQTPDPRRGGISQKVLDAFGYTAGDNHSGRWGYQMRVFSPDPLKAKGQPIIIVFRGTEGVSVNTKAPGEGALDTLIGDFAKKEPGVNQFEANRAWVTRIVKQATARGQKVVFTGHSLGGALAQEAAAAFPEVTQDVVTFQAANVPTSAVANMEKYNKAHPQQAISARHYRVDGDVVPASGSRALPGEIHYFDRVSRPAGTQGPLKITTATDQLEAQWNGERSLKQKLALGASSALPFFSPDTLQKGHVIPAVSTYLRGLASNSGSPLQPAPLSAEQQRQSAALMQYGIRDEQTVGQTMTDKKGLPVLDKNGKAVTAPAKEEVAVVFGGDYPTTQDPRLVMETARTGVVPKAMDVVGGGAAAQVFQVNIAYNTALSHLFTAASEAKSFEAFQARALVLLTRPTLKMSDFDIQLAEQLHLKTPPRDNAKQALKDLAGIDRSSAWEAAAAGTVVGGPVAGVSLGHLAREAYDDYIEGFSETPVLDEYEDPKGNGYNVPINATVQLALTNPVRLLQIWRLYHPGANK